MNVDIEIDWKSVWQAFNKWFDTESRKGDPDWVEQTKKIQTLVREHMDVFSSDSDDNDNFFSKEVLE